MDRRDFIQQCDEVLVALKQMRARDERERVILGDMVRSMRYTKLVLEGREPRQLRRVDVELVPDPHPLTPFAEPEDSEPSLSSEDIHRLLRAWLSARQYACFFGYEAGMTYVDIAESLGITESSVQVHIRRARQKIIQRRSEVFAS